jgi:hypothetical protein
MLNDTAQLARAVHRGDLAAAQKVLSEARYSNGSMNAGIRAAERDTGRDPPLPQLDRDPLPSIAIEKASPQPRFRTRRRKAA